MLSDWASAPIEIPSLDMSKLQRFIPETEVSRAMIGNASRNQKACR
jgi:hypothetical protein